MNNIWKDKKVVLIDGYARQVLPMAKAFKKLGCEVTILCFSKLDVGYATRYADRKILFGVDKEDYESQLEKVREILKTEKYDLVVPMTDYSATYLSKNKEELSNYSKIAVNDWDVFRLAIDKAETMKICLENNIGVPKTLFSDNPLNDIEKSDLKFPLVVKPKTACGSIGFNLVQNVQDLEKVLQNTPTENGEYFIQEFIPQGNNPQYCAEVYRDNNGDYPVCLIAEKPRWFPLDGGSATVNVTVHNEEMANMCKELLDKINWQGYANLDFVVDERDKKPKILEINARISAIVKIAFDAGYDISELLLNDAFDKANSEYKDYKDGICLSCCLTELLWFLKSKKRFKTKPRVFFKRHNKDVIFSFSDIKPFFAFCVQSVKNYRNAMKKRKRV